MHLNISGRIELPCKDDTIIYIEPYEIADSYFCTPPQIIMVLYLCFKYTLVGMQWI